MFVWILSIGEFSVINSGAEKLEVNRKIAAAEGQMMVSPRSNTPLLLKAETR
jgi:hypothetical protein